MLSSNRMYLAFRRTLLLATTLLCGCLVLATAEDGLPAKIVGGEVVPVACPLQEPPGTFVYMLFVSTGMLARHAYLNTDHNGYYCT